MYFRASLSYNRFIIVISIYTPTLGSSRESIMVSYEDLSSLMVSIPRADKILLFGDFNARVGCRYETWETLGRHGLGKNER